jgi:nucleotide-binding universal stress UspA family protein
MFHKILACTDGSSCALDALRMAASLAKHFSSEVVSLNVFQDPRIDYAHLGAWSLTLQPDVLERIAHEQQEAMKQHLGSLFEQMNIPCRILIETGHPVDGILRVAEKENADLIVVGSRGLRGASELFLGSVSSGILHHAKCPVLIVRGENIPCGVGDFQSILMASDGAEGAHKAARSALEIAQNYSTSLTVLNVYQNLSTVNLPVEDDALISETDVELYARRLLEMVKQDISSLTNNGHAPCSITQEKGHPGETIVRFANQRKFDLIVLGSRRMRGFERMLVGSVSNYVVHRANCPVLVVR